MRLGEVLSYLPRCGMGALRAFFEAGKVVVCNYSLPYPLEPHIGGASTKGSNLGNCPSKFYKFNLTNPFFLDINIPRRIRLLHLRTVVSLLLLWASCSLILPLLPNGKSSSNPLFLSKYSAFLSLVRKQVTSCSLQAPRIACPHVGRAPSYV
jgi:hypothetical protein